MHSEQTKQQNQSLKIKKIKKPGPAVLSRPAHRTSHDGLLVKTLHEYLAFTINMTGHAPGWRNTDHVTDLFTMTKTAKGKNKYPQQSHARNIGNRTILPG
jgi:hypothetical protein